MPPYGSLHSPSLRKMEHSRAQYGRKSVSLGNIIGDPFALATISISMVSLCRCPPGIGGAVGSWSRTGVVVVGCRGPSGDPRSLAPMACNAVGLVQGRVPPRRPHETQRAKPPYKHTNGLANTR